MEERELSDLAKAVIPKRFWRVSFDTYVPRSPSQQAALDATRSWLRLALGGKRGPMLALVGSQGTGKSHLLYAAAHELIASHKPAFIRRWYRFVDQVRYGTSVTTEAGARQKEPMEVRNDWWSSRIVLLDEIRATSGTNFDDSELARFACHAYDEELAVIITTNVHPLEKVMGPAAASRFQEVVVQGPDARRVA